ncbi:digestive organ expansion factor [Pelomyxa schiedti]|nr:digestive organ expansion factor [Pelomyxa schiedti]
MSGKRRGGKTRGNNRGPKRRRTEDEDSYYAEPRPSFVQPAHQRYPTKRGLQQQRKALKATNQSALSSPPSPSGNKHTTPNDTHPSFSKGTKTAITKSSTDTKAKATGKPKPTPKTKSTSTQLTSITTSTSTAAIEKKPSAPKSKSAPKSEPTSKITKAIKSKLTTTPSTTVAPKKKKKTAGKKKASDQQLTGASQVAQSTPKTSTKSAPRSTDPTVSPFDKLLSMISTTSTTSSRFSVAKNDIPSPASVLSENPPTLIVNSTITTKKNTPTLESAAASVVSVSPSITSPKAVEVPINTKASHKKPLRGRKQKKAVKSTDPEGLEPPANNAKSHTTASTDESSVQEDNSLETGRKLDDAFAYPAAKNEFERWAYKELPNPLPSEYLSESEGEDSDHEDSEGATEEVNTANEPEEGEEGEEEEVEAEDDDDDEEGAEETEQVDDEDEDEDEDGDGDDVEVDEKEEEEEEEDEEEEDEDEDEEDEDEEEEEGEGSEKRRPSEEDPDGLDFNNDEPTDYNKEFQEFFCPKIPKGERNFHKKQLDPVNVNKLGLVTASEKIPKLKKKDLVHILSIKKSLAEQWTSSLPLQINLLSLIGRYWDVLYCNQTYRNRQTIQEAYMLHILNHVLRSSKIIESHNTKNSTILPDQGFTRPKVLILVPLANTAFDIVQLMLKVLPKKYTQREIPGYSHFLEYFGDEEPESPKKGKNKARINMTEYDNLFRGNTHDDYYLNVTFEKGQVSLDKGFFLADIIIATPISLVVYANNHNNNWDWLSSIEILVVEQADMILMQNWVHLLTTMQHINAMPREIRVDMLRVRPRFLNNQGKYHRQNILLSSFMTPEINSLHRMFFRNIRPWAKISSLHRGVANKIAYPLQQVFQRIDCDDPLKLPDKRFTYFSHEIFPVIRSKAQQRTIIYVPSSFDFVRVRNFLLDNKVNFGFLYEEESFNDGEAAKRLFAIGTTPILLVSERSLYFRRGAIYGAQNFLFYGVPLFPQLYKEVLAFPRRNVQITSLMLYSSFEAMQLSRIVGNDRANMMLSSPKSAHLLA